MPDTARIDRPTPEELLARATAMKPALKERAQRCEQLRRIPGETIAEFEAAGFFRVLQPVEYGGYAHDPIVMLRMLTEIASACSSSAWVLGVLMLHNWEVALMPRQAGIDVWGKDSGVRISSSYAPFGKLEKVEGGVKVSGRWPYSSGSDHCTWAFLGGMVPAFTNGEPPGMVAVLISRDDYRVEDKWHVSGLEGTGSNDIVVEGAFVPDHRVHVIQNETKRTYDDSQYDEDTFKYPFFSIFGAALAATSLGMAKGALEEFIAQNKSRLSAFSGQAYREDPLVQSRVARAWALTDAAELKRERDFSEMAARIAARQPLLDADRVRNKWDSVWTAHAADEAIDLIYKVAGGNASYLTNPLQRFYRDISTAANHVYLQFDRGASNFGSFLLTGNINDPQR
ncbi:acyl-CoA dehydrogenase family protein [Acidovorax sp. JG5]|uniref:acyl-CoA dehydrogenase family protein n=1 Tax=Acidovorax sp. JG5 TaxID=2822718 RepID=UPI001B3426C2|nr:acyl-CoA dehydrogenase family protein [Acidovorax sp. JG5]MBP3982757.1 acyl-CoA dehydrogenase family protein [Acidovorax sp. JG5]